ncbi:MAG TPA: ABC transporter permease [Thermaerobacter sp.]
MTVVRYAWTVGWGQIARTARQPLSFMWIVVLPLVFAFGVGRLFAGGTDKPPAVLVVDEDRSPEAGALIAGLRATPFDVRLEAREEVSDRLVAGQEDVAIVIPAGFGQSVREGRPRLEILHGPRYEPGGVEARAQALARALTRGQSLDPLPVVEEGPRPAADPAKFPLLRTVWGVYVMFVLATLLQAGAALHEERRLGTLPRMLVLGVPYSAVIAGHGLALVLLGILQAAVFFLVSGAAGVPWLAAGPLAIALPVLGVILAASGLGMAIMGLARSAAQVRNAAAILAPSLGMLGGAFWPLDVVPATMQQAGRVSPVYWSMEAIREAFAYAGPGAGQALPLAMLLLFATLGLAAGVYGLRRMAV